jgi:putative transcriptional regulator
MNKFSNDLIKSLGEAADHAEGRANSARVHLVEVPDVRAIRRKLHLSATGIRPEISNSAADAEKNWEQGRRQPDAPAAAYLHAIAMRPREISEALKL